MKQVYEDNLIKLTDDDILFKKYYIPTFASKIIKLSRIEKIQVIKKTFFDQEIKLMGTDDFKTWYPFDSLRSKRKFLYLLFEKNKRRRIAFTVEDDEKFRDLIRGRGISFQN